MKIPVIRADLANHAVYGNFIFSVVTTLLLIISSIFTPTTLAVLAICGAIGVVVTAAIALYKEYVRDAKGGGTKSSRDFWWTMLGAVPSYIIILVLVGIL